MSDAIARLKLPVQHDGCRIGGKRGDRMKRIIQFFTESYAELKKVVWPSREEVASSTKVVIVSTLIFGVVLGVVDFLLLAGIDLIF